MVDTSPTEQFRRQIFTMGTICDPHMFENKLAEYEA
jgi:hypothetical protein